MPEFDPQYWKTQILESGKGPFNVKISKTRKLGQKYSAEPVQLSVSERGKFQFEKTVSLLNPSKYLHKIASYKMIFDFVLLLFSLNSRVKLLKCSLGYFKWVALFCIFYKTHYILLKPQK